MQLVPEYCENITENITHQEGEDNEAQGAHEIKRHHRERIVERVKIVNKIKQYLSITKSYQ